MICEYYLWWHSHSVDAVSCSSRWSPVTHQLLLCLLQETFDPEILFNLFLPPIIFHGAYTLNQVTLHFLERLLLLASYMQQYTIACAY